MLLLGLLAAGCQPRDERPLPKVRELMHTSFENFEGWAPQMLPELTTAKAHTGKYAIRIDKDHEYSAAYHMELGQLSTHRPRRLTLSAWVWVPSQADDAFIVFTISNPANLDQPVYQKYVYLTNSGPWQQWKYVSRDLDLPTEIYSHSRVAIYLWRSAAKGAVYADDFRLTELW